MGAPVSTVVRNFGGIEVDSRTWPIFYLTFPGEPITDACLADALRYVEDLLRPEGKSYQITDASLVTALPPATQRKYAVEWSKRNDALFRSRSLGGANITPSALVRGVFTAIHWFKPPPTPTVFVATREEALRHAVRALEEARIPLPAAIAAQARPRRAG
jgi:hypothetical protein